MEVQANEQAEITAQAAEAESGNKCAEVNSASLGKFKDVDALLSAYNSLEAEFTRRCTLIKELEGRLKEDNGRGKSENTDPKTAFDKDGGKNFSAVGEGAEKEEKQDIANMSEWRTEAKFLTGRNSLQPSPSSPKTFKEAAKLTAEFMKTNNKEI